MFKIFAIYIYGWPPFVKSGTNVEPGPLESK